MKSIQAMREIDRRLKAAKKAAPAPVVPWYVKAAAACAPVMVIGVMQEAK